MMSVVVEAVEFPCGSTFLPVDVLESSPDFVDGSGPRRYLDLVVIEAVDLPHLRLARLLVDVLEPGLDLVDARALR